MTIMRALIAALLSLVFSGLGHFFLRQYARGFLFILPALFLWKLTDYWPRMALANLILFIVSAFDAFSFGKRGFGIF